MNRRILILLLAALVLLVPAAAAREAQNGGVAGTEDMTDVLDITPVGVEPVTAEQLNAGTYDVKVDVSSSMFKVVGCALTVSDTGMTARLFMKSEAYSYMFPGAAEDAAQAAEAALIPLETDEDGGFFFTLPVEALDCGIACAAFSARKQLWYPRTLVIRADSLPLEAFRAETLVTPETLGLSDGAYTCAVSLAGEGRATLQTPAALAVRDGACTAEIVFSTSKIDYVIVDGQRIEPLRTDGGAAFSVPVAAFGRGLSIVVDSTAITPAVEVQYTMTFDADTLAPN